MELSVIIESERGEMEWVRRREKRRKGMNYSWGRGPRRSDRFECRSKVKRENENAYFMRSSR